MSTSHIGSIGANLTAAVHLAYFVFVVGGMAAIVQPSARDSRLVRNPWFRLLHVAAIYAVLVEEFTGLPCLLNVVEGHLRSASIGATEANEGVGGALDYLLHHTVSPLALDVMYAAFGVLVIVWLWVVPPHWRRGASSDRRLSSASR